MEKEELLQFLRENLAFELGIVKIYTEYAPNVQDEEIRAKLMILVNQSIGHAQTIRKHLLKLQFGIDKPGATMSDIDLMNFLDYGLSEETRMETIYRGVVERLSDVDMKADFEKIAEDEKSHALLLREIYAELSKGDYTLVK